MGRGDTSSISRLQREAAGQAQTQLKRPSKPLSGFPPGKSPSTALLVQTTPPYRRLYTGPGTRLAPSHRRQRCRFGSLHEATHKAIGRSPPPTPTHSLPGADGAWERALHECRRRRRLPAPGLLRRLRPPPWPPGWRAPSLCRCPGSISLLQPGGASPPPPASLTGGLCAWQQPPPDRPPSSPAGSPCLGLPTEAPNAAAEPGCSRFAFAPEHKARRCLPGIGCPSPPRRLLCVRVGRWWQPAEPPALPLPRSRGLPPSTATLQSPPPRPSCCPLPARRPQNQSERGDVAGEARPKPLPPRWGVVGDAWKSVRSPRMGGWMDPMEHKDQRRFRTEGAPRAYSLSTGAGQP